MRIHSFESAAAVDGDGVRYCVFLRGCPLRCVYCHNPDTWEMGGEDISVEQVAKKILRYKPYFKNGGGVTFSGGEPTFQAKALVPLVKRLHEQGIHVCLDTNGSIWNSDVEELLSIVDLVMLDVKQVNPERHKTLTERSNEQTLKTAKWLQDNGRPFWLRYVLVQGYSAFEEDIRTLGEHFKGYDMIKRIEVLPYHTLGAHKYEPLGMEYKLKGVKENTPQQLDEARAIFEEYFDCVFVN